MGLKVFQVLSIQGNGRVNEGYLISVDPMIYVRVGRKRVVRDILLQK